MSGWDGHDDWEDGVSKGTDEKSERRRSREQRLLAIFLARTLMSLLSSSAASLRAATLEDLQNNLTVPLISGGIFGTSFQLEDFTEEELRRILPRG